MAFNHKFPDAVPALDTAGLVALISDPKKAAELWARYETARKEYEALRAAIAAESASLGDRAKAVGESEQNLVKAVAGFEKEVADFDAAKKAWVKQRNAVEDQMAKREAEVVDKLTSLNAKEAALKEAAKTWNAKVDSDNAKLKEIENTLLAKTDEVFDREVAVAVREKKAEELAKLLKSV